MRSTGSSRILMGLGVALALMAGSTVFLVTPKGPASAEVRVPVYVLKEEVPERTLIGEALLKEASFPEDLIPPAAVTAKQDLVGKFAKVRIYPGTPVLPKQLAARPGAIDPPPTAAPNAPQGKVAQAPPSFTLGRGKTIVAVDYPEATKLITAGILQPGDGVDIYVRLPGPAGDQIALVYENKQVKAIGSLARTDAAPGPTLLFEVPPQEALYLKFIESLNPFLLVRSVEDGEGSRKTRAVDIDRIYDDFTIPRPRPASR